MNARRTGRPYFVVALLLLAMGIVSPMLVETGAAPSAATQSQLSDLIAAAGGSRSYAHSMVNYASSIGLAVAAEQSTLSQGDALLTAAQADAQSGAVAAGTQSARAAMDDYTSAATAASVEIERAGPGPTVDFNLAVQEISDVNSTASAIASVAAGACAQAGPSTDGGGTLAKECSQLYVHLSTATATLSQAYSLALQARGHANSSLGFAQAISLASSARTELNSTQPELLVIAALGYSQRGASYLSVYVHPLLSQANSTIAGEESVNSSYAAFQRDYLGYASTANASVGQIEGAGTALASAMGAVDTGSVASGVSSADSVASQVSSNVSALLNLPGISALTSLVADAEACRSATAAFERDAVTAGSDSSSYTQIGLSGFVGYVATVNLDRNNVQSGGTAYVTAYQKLIADLSGNLGFYGVLAVYDNLYRLQVAGSVNALNAALTQETAAMGTVQSDISAFASVAAGQGPTVLLPSSLLSSATSVAASAGVYLNVSGSSALSQIPASLQAASRSAVTFYASANSTAGATVGAFAAGLWALESAGSTYSAQATSTGAAIKASASHLSVDIDHRVSQVAMAQANVGTALSFFSNLEVAAGTAAMAQASIELQAAATIYGSAA